MTRRRRALLEEWVTGQLRTYFEREVGTDESAPSSELTGLTQLHSLLAWERCGPEDSLPEEDVYPYIEDAELLARVRAVLS